HRVDSDVFWAKGLGEYDGQAIQCQLGKAIARHVRRHPVQLAVPTGNVVDTGGGGLSQERQECLRDFERLGGTSLSAAKGVVASPRPALRSGRATGGTQRR